jgi:hypothetical protein
VEEGGGGSNLAEQGGPDDETVLHALLHVCVGVLHYLSREEYERGLQSKYAKPGHHASFCTFKLT